MKAYELIEKPENWTQEAGARDSNGCIASPTDKYAVKFCILGAILHCYPENLIMACGEQYDKIHNALNTSIASFNDTHTHKECYELLKKLDI